ncbi:MAG: L-threonine dehydratase catabolic TdcB [Firmicutes bacterium ADurb.Bin182]|nr:MAG: L-threonine dehydratase catabolic TdcB [Firmicutes bacterium ADurb.Bin182]
MVTLNDIKQAQERIAPYIFETPLIRLKCLDEILGCKVYIKAENLQKTYSFKLRGAMNKLLSLSPQELSRGVVTASSGNHGKGIAYGAKLLGAKAVIVVPDTTTAVKVEGIRSLGAEVIQCKKAERYDVARKLSEDHGYTLAHPFDDDLIIAGQGTAGLEIMDQLSNVSTVIVPLSGGGLLAGVATAVKSLDPHTEVIGAEPAVLPRFAESLKAGRRVSVQERGTLADALPATEPGERNFPIIQTYVDQVADVSEDFIAQGVKLLLNKAKILAEPSSAIGIGAVLEGLISVEKDDNVCFLISSGNVDINKIAKL